MDSPPHFTAIQSPNALLIIEVMTIPGRMFQTPPDTSSIATSNTVYKSGALETSREGITSATNHFSHEHLYRLDHSSRTDLRLQFQTPITTLSYPRYFTLSYPYPILSYTICPVPYPILSAILPYPP